LDGLLKRREASSLTWLGWLRQSPLKPNSRHMLEHIDRLHALRGLDLPVAGSLGWIAASSLMLYVGSFAVGLGPVFWLILAEIYPLRIRGRAMSVGTIVNWGGNLLVALTFLTLVHGLGKAGTFWLYGGITIASWLFAYFQVPETKGKTLEEIEAHWSTGAHGRVPLKPNPARAKKLR